MTISGFSFVRNATKLYYPVKESILSILPIVDEFVIALGKGDADDQTLSEIQQIKSDKIRIIHTEWDLNTYTHASVYAQQTDVAKNACKGDWLFYLQSDEVIHEKYLPVIKSRCEELVEDKEVEGLVLKYRHFWGNYSRYIVSHAFYPKEIRIIRNDPDIHSWKDAQSFRRIPNFDGKDYFQKQNTYKLKVAEVDATVYHYGWVRPPRLMQKRRKSFAADIHGEEKAGQIFESQSVDFDYGTLARLQPFREAHPAVMEDFIKRFDWADQIGVKPPPGMEQKHDRMKYRLLTVVEESLLGGAQIGGFKNYSLLKR